MFPVARPILCLLTYDDATLYEAPRGAQPVEHWGNPWTNEQKPVSAFPGLDVLLTALDTGGEALNSGQDNLKTVALLDAAYRSAKSEQIVRFADRVPA